MTSEGNSALFSGELRQSTAIACDFSCCITTSHKGPFRATPEKFKNATIYRGQDRPLATMIVFKKLCFQNVFRLHRNVFNPSSAESVFENSVDGRPNRKNKLRFQISTAYWWRGLNVFPRSYRVNISSFSKARINSSTKRQRLRFSESSRNTWITFQNRLENITILGLFLTKKLKLLKNVCAAQVTDNSRTQRGGRQAHTQQCYSLSTTEWIRSSAANQRTPLVIESQ